MIRRLLAMLRLVRGSRVTMSSEPYGPLGMPWQETLRRQTQQVPRPTTFN